MIESYLVDMINDYKNKGEQQKSILFLLNQILMKLVLCTQRVLMQKL